MQFLALLRCLVKQGPKTVQQWLDEVWDNQRPIPSDFNWQQFFAAIDTLAKPSKESNKERDLAWANIAISIYFYLIRDADSLEKVELEDRMMELKIYFMIRLGNVPGDPILDVQQVSTWFFHNLRISHMEVQESLKSLEKLNDEELLQLRLIKNRLSRIQLLAQKQILPLDEELEKWVAIQSKLP